MSTSDLPEGFWGRSDAKPMKYHFFLEDETNSLCGVMLASEIVGETERRRVGGMDCKTCAGIHGELFAVKPPGPAEDAPPWTVKTDMMNGAHVLYYQGKEYSRTKGKGGLSTQNELAALFNKNGTLPKKGKKLKCAADAPDAGKYVAKHAAKSPELPLVHVREFKYQDLEELLTYLESLFDESAIGSVKKPVYFDQVAQVLDTENEDTVKVLRWLYLARPDEIPMLCEWVAWKVEGEGAFCATSDPEPPHKESFEDLYFNIGAKIPGEALLKTIRFIFQITPPTPQTKAMSATTAAAPADLTAVPTPASHFVRWPTNREIPPEKVKIMTDSIRKNGIINPIIARTIPGKPELEIIAGETRWKGAKAIDPEFRIPTFIREMSDKDAAMLHAIDNFQRNDLNAIEEAREIQHMLDSGWNLDEIMERLGVAKDSVYNRLALLKLPEEGQTAFLEGNLSMHTVRKIMALPEDVRVNAIEAVTSPTHAAAAMPEREAVAFIEKRFVEPLKKSKEWEEKRKLLEKENPGCVWLEYEKARAAPSNFSRAGNQPGWNYLSDAAREEELVLPTWGELAKKHGSPVYIGMDYQGEAALFVSPDPIVDAEKALMDDKPEECIFTHEKAVQKTRDAAEKKKIEQQAHREALKLETKKLQNLILAPDGIKATAVKKLVEATVFEVYEFYVEFSEIADLFDILQDEELDKWQPKVEAATQKFLRSKSYTPFEAMARMHMACALGGNLNDTILVALFDSGACKPAEFPAHHAEHLKAVERQAEVAKRAEELEQERREAIARGDAPTTEDAA